VPPFIEYSAALNVNVHPTVELMPSPNTNAIKFVAVRLLVKNTGEYVMVLAALPLTTIGYWADPLLQLEIPANAAVSVEPFSPNDIALLFEKVTDWMLLLVVPALRLNAYDPVTVEPFNPNETLFEFEKTTALMLLDVVPALTFKFVMSVAAPLLFDGNQTVWFVVWAAASMSCPPELENPCVIVDALELPTISASPRL
jgi:hypothetical protein